MLRSNLLCTNRYRPTPIVIGRCNCVGVVVVLLVFHPIKTFIYEICLFCYLLTELAAFVASCNMKSWQVAVLALAAVYLCSQVHFVQGLECYVCSNQTGNTEKCLNTIKTCEPFENVCGTEIRWGSQPYFSEGALKQYYVSKRCMTKEQCQSKRRRYMQLYCTHIWYEDWACNECCQGDRCNYFVISGATGQQSHMRLLLAALLGVGLLIRRGIVP